MIPPHTHALLDIATGQIPCGTQEPHPAVRMGTRLPEVTCPRCRQAIGLDAPVVPPVRPVQAQTPPSASHAPAVPRTVLLGHVRRQNATEQRYEAWLRTQPHVLYAYFEPWPLPVNRPTWYWPDFVVGTATGIEIHEVKAGKLTAAGNIVGVWRDDARVKWKMVVALYGAQFRCVVALAVPKRAQGQYGAWVTLPERP